MRILVCALVFAACDSSNNKPSDDLSMPDLSMVGTNDDLSQSSSDLFATDGSDTDAVLAAVAPFLVSSTPANAAVGVSASTTLTLTFSKAMDTSSVTATFTPAVTLGAGAWTTGDTVVTFTPSAALAYSSTYMIAIAGKSKDGGTLAATSLKLTTAAAPDTTAPTIVSTTPSNGVTGVSPTAAVSIKFSEAMDITQLTVSPAPQGRLANPPAVTWSEGNTRATLDNPPSLESAADYTITVDGKDLAGNALTGTKSFGFTTADNIAPQVIARYPQQLNAGETNLVSLTTKPSLWFSEPMNKATVEAAFTVINEGTNGSGTTAYPCASYSWIGEQIVSCNYVTPLTNSTYYLATLTNGAKDKAGNAVSFVCVSRPPHFLCPPPTGLPPPTSMSWEYKTVAPATPPDTTPPTVVSATPMGTGVSTKTYDSPISVTFSEAMDVSSVESAFTTNPTCAQAPCGLFFWNSTNTGFDYIPFNNWPYATNVANNVIFTIGIGAKDQAGNALASAFTQSFRTLFLKTVTLPVENASPRSGYVYGSPVPPGYNQVNAIDATHSDIDVGVFTVTDVLATTCGSAYCLRSSRGFATFALPDKTKVNVTNVVAADLALYAYSWADVSQLGNLNVESVWSGTDGTLSVDSYGTSAIAGDGSTTLPTTTVEGPVRGRITSLAAGAMARESTQANRLQVRVRWDNESIVDINPDNFGVKFDASRSSLTLSYETTDVP